MVVVVVVVVVLVVATHCAVEGAAGSVLAVGSPAILVAARIVLGIRGGPVITPAEACTHQLE